MKFKFTHILVALASLLIIVSSTSYSYSPCATTAYLNTANLQCVSCKANQVANSYQTVASVCQCSRGYSASGNGGCSAISPTCSYSTNSYSLVYSLNGDSGTNACASCASNAYLNR